MLPIIPAVITLVITLAVIYVVYLIVEAILKEFPLVPPVAGTIVRIIGIVLSIVAVLKFIGTAFGNFLKF